MATRAPRGTPMGTASETGAGPAPPTPSVAAALRPGAGVAPQADAQVWPGVVPQPPRQGDATLPPRPPTFRPLPAEPQWAESPAPPPTDRISQLAQQVLHLATEVERLGREVQDLRTEVAQWRALVPVARERS